MPEMTVTVQWPDGTLEQCYSPSLVMHDYLRTGESYPLQDFLHRSGTALDEASRRVQEKYGFACTSAAAQKERLQVRAQQFAESRHGAETNPADAGWVRILAMEPPLPSTTDT